MAKRLNNALLKMGWRSPSDADGFDEDDYVDVREEFEYPLSRVGTPSQDDSHQQSHSDATESVPELDRRRIVTVHPHSYSDALIVGKSFRAGIPVIINVSNMDSSEARRMIDFAGGMTFALRGVLERITDCVFLLSPQGTEITNDRGGVRSGPYQ